MENRVEITRLEIVEIDAFSGVGLPVGPLRGDLAQRVPDKDPRSSASSALRELQLFITALRRIFSRTTASVSASASSSSSPIWLSSG